MWMFLLVHLLIYLAESVGQQWRKVAQIITLQGISTRLSVLNFIYCKAASSPDLV